uniref:Protein kinase domain-containing protein n=1 Tax=Ditylenchus dipsaci TaxID=166011 RepID=A0A915CUW7_9BILA
MFWKFSFLCALLVAVFLAYWIRFSSKVNFVVQLPEFEATGFAYYHEETREKISKVYLSLPYVQPPVGDLKLEHPRPLTEDPNRKLQSFSMPRGCHQQEDMSQYNLTTSEDCLYLNILVPIQDSEDPSGYPVLVWIHGGGFVYGLNEFYGWKQLAKHFNPRNVIVVTIQYRVAFWGFFSLGDDQNAGNLGFWDQTAALAFINKRIHLFGGNPNRVTVWGNSAGSASSHSLTISPHSNKYFHQVIQSSGSFYNLWTHTHKTYDMSKEIAEKLGCQHKDSKNIKECLKKVPVEKIWAVTKPYGLMRNSINPICQREGLIVALMGENPVTSVFAYHHGVRTQDQHLYTKANLTNYLKTITTAEDVAGDKADQLLNISESYYYRDEYLAEQDPKFWYKRFVELASDETFFGGILVEIAEKLELGWPQYMYFMDYIHVDHRDLVGIPTYTPHAYEYQYLMDCIPYFPVDKSSFSSEELELTEQLVSSFAQFVKTGNPTTQKQKWNEIKNAEEIEYLHKILKTAVKYSAIGGIGGSSLYFFYKNNYSLENIGLIRFGRAGFTASSVIIDYKWSLFGLSTDNDTYQTKLKACHSRSAQKLLDLARNNGGVFIKIGQHVAALQYLLPDEYTSTLSVLHSRAPESDLEEIKMVCKNSLHKELDEVFTDFNPKPCGAASLAQVHEARLKKTGEKVAVKIQHPKVKARSVVDIATMEFFLRIASAVFPDFRLDWLLEEAKTNLPRELDFLNEAKNADTVRKMFSHLKFLRVPKIHHEYSTDLVLTMEFCEGGQINDIEYFEKHKLNKHEICRKIGRIYSEMIFKKGFIHCDPHPGNVLVKRNEETGEEEIILLDHGLYQNLEETTRVNYSHLWLAILKHISHLPRQTYKQHIPKTWKVWQRWLLPEDKVADICKDEIARICGEMGIGEYFGLFACIVASRSWESINKGITKVAIKEEERKEIQHYASTLVPQILKVLDLMPRQMLLILKTNDLLRSITYRLGTQNRPDSFIEMTRFCVRSVYQHSIKKSHHWMGQMRLYLRMYLVLFQIYAFEHYLMFREYFVKTPSLL